MIPISNYRHGSGKKTSGEEEVGGTWVVEEEGEESSIHTVLWDIEAAHTDSIKDRRWTRVSGLFPVVD